MFVQIVNQTHVICVYRCYVINVLKMCMLTLLLTICIAVILNNFNSHWYKDFFYNIWYQALHNLMVLFDFHIAAGMPWRILFVVVITIGFLMIIHFWLVRMSDLLHYSIEAIVIISRVFNNTSSAISFK